MTRNVFTIFREKFFSHIPKKYVPIGKIKSFFENFRIFFLVKIFRGSSNRLKEENDWKREWIELAYEEYREVAVREKMPLPGSASLLSIQNSLRTAIRSRLKSKDPEFKAFVAEVELLAMIDRENEEKERKRKEKKKKKKEKKKREAEKEAEREEEESEHTENHAHPQKEEDIDGIFTPKDDIDGLDPDDRDVEIFKKFCLGNGLHTEISSTVSYEIVRCDFSIYANTNRCNA